MSEVIDVIYENGVFKPLKKVNIKEGQQLKIEIKEPKKISASFYKKLNELKQKTPQVNAHKILEEMRSDRY